MASGFIAAFNKLSEDERTARATAQRATFSGVQQGSESLEWIWSYFVAVAGDMPAFENV